ncbi:MAG TPA: hypothetical protein PKZ76_01910 [Xanthomonadaceae bacterium]|nr:hypothetical protein [Xanthomonadaceae bacterium]
MSPRFLLAALVAASFLPWPVFAGDAAVTIRNRADWDIHELYLSPSDSRRWGPDQLGQHILESGGRYLLHGIPCDHYDVRLVDEDGDVCIAEEVLLCGGRQDWTITNEILLACQLLTDE